jgi:hypothetical protein
MTSDISFKMLPPKEEIQKIVERRKAHIDNIISYMWYILPVAKKYGDRVFEVAAKSLTDSGIQTTADHLKRLAEEMQSPDGMKHFENEKHTHIGMNLTSNRCLSGPLLSDQDTETQGSDKLADK